jgi:hypothetical protein
MSSSCRYQGAPYSFTLPFNLAVESSNDLFFNLFILTKGRQASTKAQEVVDHLARCPSSREEISQPGIEPPTSSLRLGYLHHHMVV